MTADATTDDLTPTEAAALAKCSERSVLRWVERGLLPARRVIGTRMIRIARADMVRFLAGQPIVAQPAALTA